jgi:hypothetical protein
MVFLCFSYVSPMVSGHDMRFFCLSPPQIWEHIWCQRADLALFDVEVLEASFAEAGIGASDAG